MPAKRGWTDPFPIMVPVTWVPWPPSSIQRSSASSAGEEKKDAQARLAPQMLSRFDAMSKWLTLSPVSMTPMGTEAPPIPEKIPGVPSYALRASAPMAGTDVSCAGRTTPTGSTANT